MGSHGPQLEKGGKLSLGWKKGAVSRGGDPGRKKQIKIMDGCSVKGQLA